MNYVIFMYKSISDNHMFVYSICGILAWDVCPSTVCSKSLTRLWKSAYHNQQVRIC